MVVIGQIISLFGNAVMRFALPIHLLNVTGSAAVLGVVSGCAFIPLAVMSPIGGIIADRVNKRECNGYFGFFHFWADRSILAAVWKGKHYRNGAGDAIFAVWNQRGISAFRAGKYSGIGGAGAYYASECCYQYGDLPYPACWVLRLAARRHSLWGIYPVLSIAAGAFPIGGDGDIH